MTAVPTRAPLRDPRRIGILGGMSWESTTTYYRLLNEGVRERLGGLHSADILLRSFDFAPISAMQSRGDWKKLGELLAEAACSLENADAQALLIATNTMHKVAPLIEERIDIPLLHIADATALAAHRREVERPLLLATRYTMEEDFLRGRLSQAGVDCLVPEANDRTLVHDVIYDELCRGIVRGESRSTYERIVNKAIDRGADGVVFGCTEVGLLLSSDDIPLPALDTTTLHCAAAVEFMIEGVMSGAQLGSA